MKKAVIILVFSLIFINQLVSQEKQESRIPLIGEMTPAFTAQSTHGKINFPADYSMKWKIIFSHPGDFTPVCSSEILQMAAMQEDFDQLNTKLLVVSTDGLSSHIAWVKSLESIKYQGNEPLKIKFPLIADPDHSISTKFGMIHQYVSHTRDVRGVFIINPEDKIAAIFFYPMNVGRNMDEIKRSLIALQTAEKYGVLTPVNWDPGEDVMLQGPATQADAERMERKGDDSLTQLSWYMWYKKLPQAAQ